MFEQNVRPSTNNSYKSAFNSYVRFTNEYNLHTFPISEMKFLYYIAWALEKMKATSVKTYTYGIKYMANIHGYPVDTQAMPNYQRIKHSLDYTFGAKITKQSNIFTFDDLTDAYPTFNMRDYNEVVFYTIFVTIMVTLMRPSELAAANLRVNAHANNQASYKALFIRNLKMINDNNDTMKHFIISCRDVKTDKGYTNVDMVVSKGPFPFSAADMMCRMFQFRLKLIEILPFTKLSMSPYSPAFQMLDGHIVTIYRLRKRFEKMLIDMGRDPKDYSLYDMKRGAASSYAQRGVDHKVIQMLGRWKTNAYQVYIKYTPEQIANIQTELCHKPVNAKNLVFMHGDIPPQYLIKP